MNERIEKIVASPAFIPAVVGILAFSTGVVVGYNVGRRGKISFRKQRHQMPGHISLDVQDALARSRASREVIERRTAERDRSAEFNSREEFEKEIEGMVTPDEDITVSIRPVPDDNGDENTIIVQSDLHVVVPDSDPSIQHHIFAHGSSEWSYEDEMATRTEEKPYVIHRDEFYGEEKDYVQTSLTYYEGDNIMVDEEDVPVYNFEDVVGPLKWGHGSDDPNVFHVRNDRLNAEYEVLFDRGHYSVEILGLETVDQKDPNEEKHLKHSEDHVRRFRSDD